MKTLARLSPVAALLLTGFALTACSRSVENAPLADATVVTGPTRQDTRLALLPRPSAELQKTLRTEKEIDTAAYFRLVEDLAELSSQQRSEATLNLSRQLYEAYYAQPAARAKLSGSLYLQAILGEGEPEVKKELAVIAKDLRFAIAALTDLLDRSRTTYPWPQRPANFAQFLTAADNYAVWLVDQIGRLGLEEQISRTVRQAVRDEYQKYRPRVVSLIERLQGARYLGQALGVVKTAIAELGMKIGAAERQQIRQAEGLAASIAATDSDVKALALLIQVWRMLPPAEREPVFRAVSPEFYEFLEGKSESDLDCLSASVCFHPILGPARRLVILPKINRYGVDNIRAMVDTSAKDYLLQSVLKMAGSFLPELPGMVKQTMLAQAGKYQELVARIQADFSGFTRRNFERWEKTNFPDPVRGLETTRVAFKFRGKNKLSVKPRANVKGFASGAETLGASLAVAQLHVPEKKSARQAALVAPLVKLLAISGFRQAGSGKTFPSLLFPLDGPRDEVFEIKNLLQGKTSFAVPDSFSASEGFVLDRKDQKAHAGVGGQAELLRGISRQIRFHRDWEENLFDRTLGNIQVEDVVTEIPRGSVHFSVFPKDVVFALSVGSAAAILQNIIRDLSPAFLLLPGGEQLWGNQYDQIGEGKLSTVAGLVNIEDGQRGRTVKTADIARYILALDEFLTATEGIENTKAKPLLEVGADGRTVLDQLLEARRYLRLFQMGLTNFLVYVAQDKDGGFHGSYTFDGKTMREPSPRSLADQVLAVRALVASARRLELATFSWAALDGYYFMNRSLWDKTQQFYATSLDGSGARSGSAGLAEISATIRGIEELSPYMPGDVRAQWEQVNKPWVRALEDF